MSVEMGAKKVLPANVLHVHSGNMYGGVETTLRTIAQYQAGVPGPEHRFALCFEGRLIDELRSEGCKVYRLPEAKTRRPWTVIQARKVLGHVIRQEQIDIVICHMPWALALFGGVSQIAGAVLVFWAHEIHHGDHWLERWAARRSPTFALTNSEVTRRGVAQMFPKLPSQVLYCPVAPAEVPGAVTRAEKRTELNVKTGQTVILQVSRLERWKGHSLHLKALSTLVDRDDWVCWIVGGAQRRQEERYLAELHLEAKNLGLSSRVTFLGQRWDVAELMRAADIFCQPNTSPEPFGIVFIEALRAGLPVVTFAMGGATEILNRTCGLLAEPNDTATLATYLRMLVASPSLRRSLGERGLERAIQLSDPEKQLIRLSELLSNAYRLVVPKQQE